MLLILVIWGVGVLRSFFTPERTRTILAGKREIFGDVMAALLGVVTPFCSCSAVPLFIGFVEAGIPIGVTFAFLDLCPHGERDRPGAALRPLRLAHRPDLYVHGLAHRHGDRHDYRTSEYGESGGDWVYELRMGQTPALLQEVGWMSRIDYGLHQVEICGAGLDLHSFGDRGRRHDPWLRSEDFLAALMGKQVWWSVPVAVILGAPLYSNAAGIIPVVQALLEKGAALGTVLAFMMSIIGISFRKPSSSGRC